MTPGVWSLDIRIEQGSWPVRTHSRLSVRRCLSPRPNPSGHHPRLRPSTIFWSASPSVVWVHKLDETGRRTDTASGFVIGKETNRYRISGGGCVCESLEVEFSGGRKAVLKELLAWSELEIGPCSPPIRAEPFARAPEKPKEVRVGGTAYGFNVRG